MIRRQIHNRGEIRKSRVPERRRDVMDLCDDHRLGNLK